MRMVRPAHHDTLSLVTLINNLVVLSASKGAWFDKLTMTLSLLSP